MLLGLLAEARRQGHQTEAVFGSTTRGAPWLEDFARADIPVTLGPESGSRVRLGRWLDDYLGSDPEPVVLHTHFTAWDVPALIAARGREAAVFWHVHSALPHDPLVVGRTVLKFGVLGRSAAGLLCPAPNIVDGARRRMAPRDRTHFIPSSLDLASFPVLDEERRTAAREELGLPLDAKVLLHFGWHWHLKGSDIFLEVLRRLAADDEKIIGIDRGGGDEMIERAAELGIGDRFRLIPPVEDVRTVHGAADVNVSSSREEGMAYAVLESLASGTAVVASAIPGHAVIGEHMDACRLTSTDPAELAAAITETLARTPTEAQREAEDAHKWMEENLAHAPVARRVIRLYEEALPAKPGAPAPGRRVETRPRLIQLCNFANVEAGSFVPMVAAVVEHARELGLGRRGDLLSTGRGHRVAGRTSRARARPSQRPSRPAQTACGLGALPGQGGSGAHHRPHSLHTLRPADGGRCAAREPGRRLARAHSALVPAGDGREKRGQVRGGGQARGRDSLPGPRSCRGGDQAWSARGSCAVCPKRDRRLQLPGH